MDALKFLIIIPPTNYQQQKRTSLDGEALFICQFEAGHSGFSPLRPASYRTILPLTVSRSPCSVRSMTRSTDSPLPCSAASEQHSGVNQKGDPLTNTCLFPMRYFLAFLCRFRTATALNAGCFGSIVIVWKGCAAKTKGAFSGFPKRP